MNPEKIAPIVLAAVLLTAIGGIYVVMAPAQLTGAPVIDVPQAQTDTVGMCCCGSQNNIFIVPSTVLTSELTDSACDNACAEHASTRHPVASLGSC